MSASKYQPSYALPRSSGKESPVTTMVCGGEKGPSAHAGEEGPATAPATDRRDVAFFMAQPPRAATSGRRSAARPRGSDNPGPGWARTTQVWWAGLRISARVSRAKWRQHTARTSVADG